MKLNCDSVKSVKYGSVLCLRKEHITNLNDSTVENNVTINVSTQQNTVKTKSLTTKSPTGINENKRSSTGIQTEGSVKNETKNLVITKAVTETSDTTTDRKNKTEVSSLNTTLIFWLVIGVAVGLIVIVRISAMLYKKKYSRSYKINPAGNIEMNFLSNESYKSIS